MSKPVAGDQAPEVALSDERGTLHRLAALPFTLLSDEDHAVAEAYGAWTLKNKDGREYMGIQRSSFLVDPDGLIAYAWPTVKADGHAADVYAQLATGKADRAARLSAG